MPKGLIRYKHVGAMTAELLANEVMPLIQSLTLTS
jgi:hypothetical protein